VKAVHAILLSLAFTFSFLEPPARIAADRLHALPKQYDVVVVGSTPAAIAAALASAHRGLRTLLITQATTLGGDLTLGLLTHWDLQHGADGRLLQRGIFQQFYQALPNGFSPLAASAYFQKRITGDRRITWLRGVGELHAGTVTDGRASRILSVNDARGRCFIDATSDGDLAAEAGARYDVGRQDQGRDTRMQPATLIFMLRGVDWARALASFDPRRDGLGRSKILKKYRPLSDRAVVRDANFQLQRDGTVMVNAIDIVGVDGRNAGSLASARVLARRESRNLVRFFRRSLPGFARASIARFAPQMYVRETRHVLGLFRIDGKYVWSGSRTYDTVVLASYPIDVHPVTADAVAGDGWAAEPHVYGIPLRALIVAGFENLAIVGPAISATHDAAGSLRVLPTTVAEGESAGNACAASIRTGRNLSSLRALRARLGEQGRLPPAAI